MKKGLKRGILIIAGFLVICLILIVTQFVRMGKATEQALAKQVNEEIDMEQIPDGIYNGSSDAGLVYVEVNVTVEDHKITKIDLIKHENGKGKPAEAILDEMIAQNTDDVDAVSGATASSKTIRNAVNKALQQGLTQNAQGKDE